MLIFLWWHVRINLIGFDTTLYLVGFWLVSYTLLPSNQGLILTLCVWYQGQIYWVRLSHWGMHWIHLFYTVHHICFCCIFWNPNGLQFHVPQYLQNKMNHWTVKLYVDIHKYDYKICYWSISCTDNNWMEIWTSVNLMKLQPKD